MYGGNQISLKNLLMETIQLILSTESRCFLLATHQILGDRKKKEE